LTIKFSQDKKNMPLLRLSKNWKRL